MRLRKVLLLSLGGLGLSIVSILWLKQSWNSGSFRAVLALPAAHGIEVGTPLTYRGVEVGRVIDLNPEPQSVKVAVKIWPADRRIPSQSSIRPTTVKGKTVLDITPTTPFSLNQVRAKPTDPKCDPNLIICSSEKTVSKKSKFINPFRSLRSIEVNIEDMERSVEDVNTGVQNVYSGLENTNTSVKNIEAGVQDIRAVAKPAEIERTLISLQKATREVSQLSEKVGTLSDTANRLLLEVERSGSINRLNTTLSAVTSLAEQVQSFLALNQNNLTTTLTHIGEASQQLTSSLHQLEKIGTRVEQSKLLDALDSSNLLENLETISVNAAEISANLRNASVQLNDPETILKIQKILDSARSVFENLNKITSDVDELTGNPKLRQELLRIIEGLSSLLSSTQLLEEQVNYAQKLTQISAHLQKPMPAKP